MVKQLADIYIECAATSSYFDWYKFDARYWRYGQVVQGVTEHERKEIRFQLRKHLQELSTTHGDLLSKDGETRCPKYSELQQTVAMT